MKTNTKKTIMLWAGHGESGIEYSGREWQKLCTLIKKASEREALHFITDKLQALKTAEQKCYLMKDDCHRLATALERVLPRGERYQTRREEAEGFISFLWDADGFEKN
jgi:hypothetical protein